MSENDKVIELLEKIDKKLGFLIGENIKEKHERIKDQVNYLNNLTKDYTEIAFMLGITPSHAAKELSKLKKKVRK